MTGVRTQLEIEIETGEPETYHSGRWASIKLGGHVVYQDFVYDVDPEGNRTAEQAEQNILSMFGYRLSRVLGGEDG